MKVLVTGGCGFIGFHLVQELLKKGYDVRVLDYVKDEKYNTLKDLIKQKKIEFINGDIRDIKTVDKAVEGVEYVFHQAAMLKRPNVTPSDFVTININGSLNIFEFALKHNVKKVMFASTVEVYGAVDKFPIKEDAKYNPPTLYAVSKIVCEHLLKQYSEKGLNYIVLRYFNLYGIRQKESVVLFFIKKLLNNESPIIFNNGKQKMDFINVKDIAKANILAMESDVKNETFNVATGTSTSILDLANLLIKKINPKIKPIFNTGIDSVTIESVDITKIKNKLNFKPSMELSESLDEMIKHVKENPELYP